MKKALNFIISFAFIICAFTPVVANAKGNKGAVSASDISINAEYLIRDVDGLHSRYVVLATNNSDSDIVVDADFFAVTTEGTVLQTVHDSAEAVKAGQTFIVYGQFKNDSIEGAGDFKYELHPVYTANCRYDAVNIEIQDSDYSALSITGTNYSDSDINAVNVRGIFFKDGQPVAFDTVNVGDKGYTLHSGATTVQELGMFADDYDDYVITYTATSDTSFSEDF